MAGVIELAIVDVSRVDVSGVDVSRVKASSGRIAIGRRTLIKSGLALGASQVDRRAVHHRVARRRRRSRSAWSIR